MNNNSALAQLLEQNNVQQFMQQAPLVLEQEPDFDWNFIEAESGRCLLHWACVKGSLSAVKFLLGTCMVNVNIPETYNQTTPFHFACREGNLEIIEYICATCKNLNINAQDKDGYSALHFACANKHYSVVDYLLKEFAATINVNLIDSLKRTPLMRAVEQTSLACVRLLLKRKDIDVNKQNHHGFTALHIASYNQLRQTSGMLIEAGASIELVDRDGHKALHWGLGFWQEEDGGCTCPKGNHTH